MLLVLTITNILSFCMLMGDARVVEDIKLFDEIDLSALTEAPGSHSNSKAYVFTKTTGDLIAPANISYAFARESFLIKQFSVKTYLQVAKDSDGGTIVFLSNRQGDEAFSLEFTRKSDSIEVDAVFRVAKTSRTVDCKFKNIGSKIPKDEWLHLDVRIYLLEKLLRCEIKTAKGDIFYRNSIIDNVAIIDQPIEPFPLNGTLRMAQKFLPVSEHLPVITEQFVGNLQDVIISFGDPNCTILIDDSKVPATVKPTIQQSTATKRTTPAPTSVQCPTTSAKDDTCPGDGKKHQNGEKWDDGKNGDCECKKGNTFCVKQVRRCVQGGKVFSDGDTWDDTSNCDKCRCDNGVVRCGSTTRTYRKSCDLTCDKKVCENPKDGCYCPENMVLLDGKCQDEVACPCMINGQKYKPGSYIINCDVCVCSSGKQPTCYKGIYC
ncbi:uncharacterized protein LOC114521617 [Dendronephthya gigantea]|uniref:uncharacterized protein LOC114521617 n=1 Tax=Dendronephthya gigantea TaxID=151771 RepID=UPI00106A9459|nr:uncharacterized protein LOC114521617 [Dendronephthya gigantea]